jgi:hypothetical protein
MNTYTIYNNESIKMTLTSTEEVLLLNLQEGESYIEGDFSDEFYYVKNNEIKQYPEKPDYPVNFNIDSEEWEWNEITSWAILRDMRDNLLIENVDPIVSNPLRWNSMTSEKQTEYTNYRQALLDLPENTEDPRNPIFPTPPE